MAPPARLPAGGGWGDNAPPTPLINKLYRGNEFLLCRVPFQPHPFPPPSSCKFPHGDPPQISLNQGQPRPINSPLNVYGATPCMDLFSWALLGN